MILHISNGERGYLFRSKRWQSSGESSNNEYLSTYAEHSNFVLYVVLYLKSIFNTYNSAKNNIFFKEDSDLHILDSYLILL